MVSNYRQLLFSVAPAVVLIDMDGVLADWDRGFAVDNPTLIRFFSLHFILPFLIAGASIVHLLFLHQTDRSNPLGLNRNFDKISFHPYFSLKDLFGFFVILFIFRGICFFYP